MNDLISRQDAIDTSLYADGFNDGYAQCKRDAQDTSAQLNLQPTCNNLAIDCISRQAAIEEICTAWKIDDLDNLTEAMLVDMIEALPSAQPDIVRCKDCKHFAGEGMYCSCDIIVQFDHFYCYYAERRTDG